MANSIFLCGRLTKDIELKYGQSGKAYGRFTLAVSRPRTKDETDFINCVAFGKSAEILGQYVRKGDQLAVTGILQQSQYEVNGEKRTSYDVVVDTFDLLGNRGDKEEKQERKSALKEHLNTSEENFDDEFPF